MAEKEKWQSHKIHENIPIKGTDLFENPSEFLKVDEILVNVKFPTIPGLNEEVVIYFPSIKVIGIDGNIETNCWFIRSKIDENDGKEGEDPGTWIYRMSDIVSDRKKGNTIVFKNLQEVIDENETLESLFSKIKFKVIFDNDIWKIYYKKDKLNMKLKKIKNIK